MTAILSVFNNKGGVGKTTYLYHIAHLLRNRGLNVLMVDCDSQCNLTSYNLEDNAIIKAWGDKGNSIYKVIELVEKGMGDFRKRRPENIKENLWLIPGDVNLSNFEDRLGDSWNRAKGGSESDIRIQSAIFRYIEWVVEQTNVDIVLIDLGPNLGALNRAVLSGSDYFLVPISPDLFSIKGTENLGNKLLLWRSEWEQCNFANKSEIAIPNGTPSFIGYVMQQHNTRNNSQGMTKGWNIFGNQVEDAINTNIVDKLQPLNQTISFKENDFNLGKIPNLHSLIPYSLAARKPVFECKSSDGLRGAHITSAKESVQHFNAIVEKIMNLSFELNNV